LDVTPSRSDAGDAQYVLILNPANGVISQTLLWQLSNAQAWQGYVFDLAPYAGQAILLHFGVLNDGAGGSTGLYVDDVSLVVIGPLPHRLYLPVILRGYPGD
jgi:bacillopeptidase F (M6 metalloprotease family)